MIVSGNVEVLDGEESIILCAADYFGHEHLLRKNNNKVLTIGALNTVFIAEIDRNTFFNPDIFGPVVKALERKLRNIESPPKVLKSKTQSFLHRQYSDWAHEDDDLVDTDEIRGKHTSEKHISCNDGFESALPFCGVIDVSSWNTSDD
jgi:hypothetical protein